MLVASLSGAETIEEDFSSPPSVRGWRTFGDSSLFHWNAALGNLEVIWDSSRSNSYCYRPLGTVLAKTDDFSLQFDLRLASITGGTNPDKPSSFEIAVGLFNIASATHSSFSRGTGTHSPNLVEFDYFPPADIIAATVSPTIVSSNSTFQPSFTFPLEMTAGADFRVLLSYTASNQTLVTTITRNGAPFGPVKDLKLRTGFADFRVDAFSISSYSDSGDPYGSVLAHGTIDNLLVTLPPPPISAIHGSFYSGAYEVNFLSRSNWLYTLERNANLSGWSTIAPAHAGTGERLTLIDPQPSGEAQFYRVRAERP